MIKKLRGLVLVGCLALAPSAFAIPFTMAVTNSGFGGASGTWGLWGPTNTGGAFSLSAGLLDTYTANRNIAAGDYVWGISGVGNFSTVTWTLWVNGNLADGGAGIGGWRFRISDRGEFTAAVPEPGTLALLGMGLLGIGLSIRRRRSDV